MIVCKHVIVSGEKKGNRCGNLNVSKYKNITMPYCYTHINEHENECKEEIDKITRMAREKEDRKKAYQEKIENRELSAEIIFDKIQKQYMDLFKESEKDPNSNIIKDMDKTISEIIKNAYNYKYQTEIILYPCNWCGYTKEEIISELEKRGFYPIVYTENKIKANCDPFQIQFFL